MRRVLVAALFVLGFGLAGAFSATVVASTTGTTTTGTTATTTVATTTVPTTPKPKPPPKPGRIAAHVTIGGIAVGGSTAANAEAIVRKAFARRLRIVVVSTRYAPRPTKFGAVARIKLAVAHAMSADEGTAVPLSVTVQGAKVRAFVAATSKRFDRVGVDATLSLKGGKPYVSPDVTGRTLRRKEAVQKIVHALQSNTRPSLVLRFDTTPAGVTSADFTAPLIVIHRGSNRLDLYYGAKLRHEFPVATGQSIYPTPLGKFSIVVKWVNPWWYPPTQDAWAKGLKPVPPGPGNPLGTRWMGLSAPGVGIHGTNEDSSIGYSESHGCIRMHIPDAEWLFGHVEVGTTVYIVSS